MTPLQLRSGSDRETPLVAKATQFLLMVDVQREYMDFREQEVVFVFSPDSRQSCGFSR